MATGLQARRKRVALVTSMLMTYGYGILGAADLQAFFIAGANLSIRQFLAAGVGVAMHGLALYIAPRGDSHAAD